MFISINRSIAESKARRENNEKGFTLIELLVVVLIIGVLSAIAIPIFLGQQKQAKLAAIESDLSSAKTAIVAQLVTGGAFPADGDVLGTDFTVDGFASSNSVTITFNGDADAFCLEGVHADYPTDAADKRHVADTGGVVGGVCP